MKLILATALYGFILAGERVAFDADATPRFSERQIRATDAATREGLAKWAKTEHGRAFVARFDQRDYRIFITEDTSEGGIGRAPQPAIGTIISADDPSKMKIYQVILNPDYVKPPPASFRPFREPATAAEMMAAAWAGEMLHIYFYSQGIVLPHHGRSDFEREWEVIAGELGFPGLRHDRSR